MILLVATALAAPLTVDPAHPPAIVALSADGMATLRFPELTHDVRALPAVVIALADGAEAPAELRAAGVPLGRSERTWRVVVPHPADLVAVSVRWAADPAVASAVPDLVLPKDSRFDDPEYASQWYLDRLGMDALYAKTLGEPSVHVAIIDSGIQMTHPDLAGAFIDPYDAYADDDDPSPNPGEFCQSSSTALCDEHGTAVSGIVGARANNRIGIVGMCPECALVPIKLLGDGNGALSADVHAFEHAIDSDAGVINNSWGYVDPTPVPAPLASVIHRASTESRGGLGAVVVFAAGNDDRELGNDELEALPDVVCVSATDSYGNPTAYTNFGDATDVAAPSATFTTTVGGGYTSSFGGTSAAAPVVSGLAGWIVSAAPDMSAAEVHQLLIDTAIPSPLVTADANGHHPIYGYGNLSPANILEALFPSADTDTEGTPKGCGCESTGGSAWGAVVVALLGMRTRSRRNGRR